MITADQLMSGPRGRRMLLAFALASDHAGSPEYTEESLWHAVMHAAYDLDPGRGVSRVIMSVGYEGTPLPMMTPEDVALRLTQVKLVDATPEVLRESLAQAVDNSRPYQEPDGEDFLAETPAVFDALRSVADHISQSPHIGWWDNALDPDDQWAIEWFDPATYDLINRMPQTFSAWKEHVVALNLRAQRERPDDPAARWSGEWWSIPPSFLKRTSRSLFDGSPVGLWFEEDRGKEESAVVRQLNPPADMRVYEITTAADWADLCRRYPLDLSYEKRHDWYHSTGRVGRWVTPDWSLVAEDYDAVHLSAVGIAIPVDDETASVIAGWNPDETWWLTDVTMSDESTSWVLETLPDYSRVWVQR
ncbi:MAG: hypothetical protein M9953_03725 [Thermomicrobiales bacterium]|nr:hypothetical protein [Thermomicrobiales bacterium]